MFLFWMFQSWTTSLQTKTIHRSAFLLLLQVLKSDWFLQQVSHLCVWISRQISLKGVKKSPGFTCSIWKLPWDKLCCDWCCINEPDISLLFAVYVLLFFTTAGWPLLFYKLLNKSFKCSWLTDSINWRCFNTNFTKHFPLSVWWFSLHQSNNKDFLQTQAVCLISLELCLSVELKLQLMVILSFSGKRLNVWSEKNLKEKWFISVSCWCLQTSHLRSKDFQVMWQKTNRKSGSVEKLTLRMEADEN